MYAVISPVVTKAGAFLGGMITDEFNLVNGVKEELSEISRSLTTITKVLDDAEYKGMKDQTVKHWLNKLEITACEMADILDEWEYYTLRKQKTEPSVVQKLLNFLLKTLECCFIPSSCLCFNEDFIRRDIAKKIQNAKASLDQIFKEMDGFNFICGQINSPPATHPVHTSWREETTHLIDLNNVHGSAIHNLKDDIVRELMISSGIQILSIVGTGGLGKTTLAKLVYKQVMNCFELRIWICVSDPFDVAKVSRGIVECVTKNTPKKKIHLDSELEQLRDCIKQKKFLLVLDDAKAVPEKKWEALKISLQCGAPGSKILVITRKESVAKMMGTDVTYHPKLLSPDECWSLLRKTSFPGKNEHKCGEYEDVGKKIANKCKGLPLAAIVLGRHLQDKNLEGWKHVEKSDIWELEDAKVDQLPHLFLSYNELSPALKRCFSYCAVYPKDHRIHAVTLIEEWILQGYLHDVRGNGAIELKGREYLENLEMRCLLQDIEKSESGEHIEWCKMHDIVHDFALYLRENDAIERSCQTCGRSLVSLVQKYRSLSWNYRDPLDQSCQVCDCMKSLRLLSIDSEPPPLGMDKLIHLRRLDVSCILLSKDDLKILCRLYFLKNLLLSGCNLTEIPREIGNLVQLRQLDLSENGELKQLPKSIGSLVELQTLSLEGCSIEEIPREIGNLIQLRRLDLSGNDELKQLPESIGSLVELRSLFLAGCSLKEIQKEIGKLVQLRRLDLSRNREIMELPESICSLVELQILKIEGTDIKCLPEALGELSNLCMLGLKGFKVGSEYNKLRILKKLHHHLTGSLELEIHLSSTSEMEELVEDAQQAEIQTVLQKLETLVISFWCRINKTEKVVEALVPHYKLKTLKIIGYKDARLPYLMSSPFNVIKQIYLTDLSQVSSLPAMGKLPFLESLYIQSVEQLKLVGREFLGIESLTYGAFAKLGYLSFAFCSKWEEWEDITEKEEESAAITIMPCLTHLSIKSCESLKKLPHRLLRKVSSSLRRLNIWDSPELIKTYGDDKEGSAWRSISQHNPQLQLHL